MGLVSVVSARALASADARGWVADGATVVWEEASEVIPPAGFDLLDARRYGQTSVTFLKRRSAGS